MNRLNIKHWISLVLSICLLLSVGINISQKQRIDDLEAYLYNCQEEKEKLILIIEEVENKVEELEFELDVCQNEKDDFDSNFWN